MLVHQQYLTNVLLDPPITPKPWSFLFRSISKQKYQPPVHSSANRHCRFRPVSTWSFSSWLVTYPYYQPFNVLHNAFYGHYSCTHFFDVHERLAGFFEHALASEVSFGGKRRREWTSTVVQHYLFPLKHLVRYTDHIELIVTNMIRWQFEEKAYITH